MAITSVGNLTQFRAKLKLIPERIADAAQKAEAEIAGQALRRIIKATPVDTGRARGNWNITFNQTSKDYDWNQYDKTGSLTLSKGLTKLLRMPVNLKRIYINNGVPYVRYLETGTSRMKAYAMVRSTFASMKVDAKSILRAKIAGLRNTLYR